MNVLEQPGWTLSGPYTQGEGGAVTLHASGSFSSQTEAAEAAFTGAAFGDTVTGRFYYTFNDPSGFDTVFNSDLRLIIGGNPARFGTWNPRQEVTLVVGGDPNPTEGFVDVNVAIAPAFEGDTNTDVYIWVQLNGGYYEDMATVSFTLNTDPVSPGPGPDPGTGNAEPCEEHGRTTRIYASGYHRDRVHESRLLVGERRCLVFNFNGAIPVSRKIASVSWRMPDGHSVEISGKEFSDREAQATIDAKRWGETLIRCIATLDNGESYVQACRVMVKEAY